MPTRSTAPASNRPRGYLLDTIVAAADADELPKFRDNRRYESLAVQKSRQRRDSAISRGDWPGTKPPRLGITWRTDEAEPGSVYLTHVATGSRSRHRRPRRRRSSLRRQRPALHQRNRLPRHDPRPARQQRHRIHAQGRNPRPRPHRPRRLPQPPPSPPKRAPRPILPTIYT